MWMCTRSAEGTLADLGCEAVFTAIFSFSSFGRWSSGIRTVLSAISGGLFRTVAQGGDLLVCPLPTNGNCLNPPWQRNNSSRGTTVSITIETGFPRQPRRWRLDVFVCQISTSFDAYFHQSMVVNTQTSLISISKNATPMLLLHLNSVVSYIHSFPSSLIFCNAALEDSYREPRAANAQQTFVELWRKCRKYTSQRSVKEEPFLLTCDVSLLRKHKIGIDMEGKMRRADLNRLIKNQQKVLSWKLSK